MSEEEYETIAESKKELKCGHTKFYELLNSGKIKAVKFGRSTRVLKASRRNYMASLPAYKPEAGA